MIIFDLKRLKASDHVSALIKNDEQYQTLLIYRHSARRVMMKAISENLRPITCLTIDRIRTLSAEGGETMNVESASINVARNPTKRYPRGKQDRKQLHQLFATELAAICLADLPLAFALTFKYLPFTGLVVAFKDYKIARGFWGSEWVGFEVFREIFANRDFLRAVRNTLLLNSLDLIFSFTMPILLALLLNEIKSVTLQANQSDAAVSAALPVLGYYRSARLSAAR